MVGVTGKVLVDQVEGVPLLVLVLVHVSAIAVGDKGLVGDHLQIEFEDGIELLFLHPLTAIAGKLDGVVGHFSELLHYAGTHNIVLA